MPSDDDAKNKFEQAREFVDLFKTLAYKESECTLDIHEDGETQKLAEMESILENLLVAYHL